MKSIAANLALAAASLVLFFGALELTLRALDPWLAAEEGREVAFYNPNDPRGEKLELSPTTAEHLADSVVYHLRSNVLTIFPVVASAACKKAEARGAVR